MSSSFPPPPVPLQCGAGAGAGVKGIRMKRTGIVRDEAFLGHRAWSGHPESPKRLEVLYSMMDETGPAGLVPVSPPRAKRSDLARVHTPEYIDTIADTEGRAFTPLDPDTAASSGSYDAALRAAGGVCEAIAMVASGKLDNAFAAVRPPGHHAEKGRAKGFCLFNNVAIGARYAQDVLGLARILVVDWDLHHGNGTQHCFERDPSVLYFSVHQYPYYPGTGGPTETGKDDGKGFTVNVPLAAGHGDGEYMGIFERVLKPVALEFNPHLILVSAGFDSHRDDPLGGMRVTEEGFGGMARCVLDVAEECCGGKVVMTLEGGYNLRGLRNSVKEVLDTLSGHSEPDPERILSRGSRDLLDRAVGEVSRIHGKYWKSLA